MDSPLYTRPDPGGGPCPPAMPSLRESVYAKLRAAVLDGGFGPRERLAETRLAARFGVSRTPVREGLARLLADGLIEHGDDGLFVTVPSLAQLKDFWELRVTLELRGIVRAEEDSCLRHDRAVLTAELERWYAMRERPPAPGPRFVVEDERFHAELSRASGNPALTAALVAAGERVRRVRMYDFLTEARVGAAIAEHIEIMEHVRDGRLGEGHRALRAHVGGSMAVVTERAQQAMTQMALHADRLRAARQP
ncbi:GntR family transcriptional regulator [Streptomyces nitrosporeus]|uniref:GntR family transcriptional regulator n=2 Tax=Streptomyces nitrosporeus TaxID=28894 RepID=A0A5J6F384_9ACTN|nr:GntR family transcriptional regulator [Streptomyces nitrosporeus]QEU70769.1 GntR family transcriptional regulator [Streptomyces nitrosporeus]